MRYTNQEYIHQQGIFMSFNKIEIHVDKPAERMSASTATHVFEGDNALGLRISLGGGSYDGQRCPIATVETQYAKVTYYGSQAQVLINWLPVFKAGTDPAPRNVALEAAQKMACNAVLAQSSLADLMHRLFESGRDEGIAIGRRQKLDELAKVLTPD
jgi:hypothetical protein